MIVSMLLPRAGSTGDISRPFRPFNHWISYSADALIIDILTPTIRQPFHILSKLVRCLKARCWLLADSPAQYNMCSPAFTVYACGCFPIPGSDRIELCDGARSRSVQSGLRGYTSVQSNSPSKGNHQRHVRYRGYPRVGRRKTLVTCGSSHYSLRNIANNVPRPKVSGTFCRRSYAICPCIIIAAYPFSATHQPQRAR